MTRTTLPDDVRRWCRAETRLAEVDRRSGRPAAALARLQSVLARAGATLDGPDPAVAETLVALGTAHVYAGQYDHAEAAYRRVLLLGDPGPQQPAADALGRLGALSHLRGVPQAGIGVAEQGLALREATLGAEDPAAARDRIALATLYRAEGRLDAAGAALRRALDDLERAHGGGRDLALGWGNLAVVRAEEGAAGEAAVLGERTLAVLGPRTGSDPLRAALVLLDVGVALRTLGIPASAPALATAVTVLRAVLPPGHPVRSAAEATTGCR